ncbi:hypothetical protein BKA69DRAFT_1070314 [Paraphysoderma sedebokerense]|nr:hypothetical protein BKA69DRAFT_1070314 [Paraphysoderma sedebokerense]
MALIILLSFTTILFELLCLFLLFKVPSYLAFKVICVLFVLNCSLGYYDFRKFLKTINLKSLHGADGIVDIDSASAKEENDSVSRSSEIKVDKGAIRRRRNGIVAGYLLV